MTPLLKLTMRLAWPSQFSWSKWPHFSYLQWGWHGWISSYSADDPTSHTYNEAGMAESVLMEQMTPLLKLTMSLAWLSLFSLSRWPPLFILTLLQWGWHGWVSSYSADDPTSHTYSEAQWHLLNSLTLAWPWSSMCCSPGFHADVSGCKLQSGIYRTSLTLAWPSLDHMCVVFSGSMLMSVHTNSRVASIDLFNLGLTSTGTSVCHFSGLIIIICNTYIAPNPSQPAQSTLQFKTRMNIRINTWNMHTPDDPKPTAKSRQTCTHPGTVSATQTCNAAIHGPWTHLMTANQIQRAS